MQVPWRLVEAMAWEIGRTKMAQLAGVVPFGLATSKELSSQKPPRQLYAQGPAHPEYTLARTILDDNGMPVRQYQAADTPTSPNGLPYVSQTGAPGLGMVQQAPNYRGLNIDASSMLGPVGGQGPRTGPFGDGIPTTTSSGVTPVQPQQTSMSLPSIRQLINWDSMYRPQGAWAEPNDETIPPATNDRKRVRTFAYIGEQPAQSKRPRGDGWGHDPATK